MNKQHDLLLSIVIPVYNAEKYIQYTLDSLLVQGLEPEQYEILCIDDGSKDGSAKIIEQYQKLHSFIKYYYKENEGVSSARNYGIAVARGEFIAFIDADDYIKKNSYGMLINQMLKENVNILQFGFRSVFEHIEPEEIDKDFACEKLLIDPRNAPASTWTLIMRREILEKYRLEYPVGVRIGEDLTFNYILFSILKDYPMLKTSERCLQYFIDKNSSSHKIDPYSIEWSRRRVEDKIKTIQFCKDFIKNGKGPQASNKPLQKLIVRNMADIVLQLLRLPKDETKKGMRFLRKSRLYPYRMSYCIAKYDALNNAYTYKGNRVQKTIGYKVKDIGYNLIRMLLSIHLVFGICNVCNIFRRKRKNSK